MTTISDTKTSKLQNKRPSAAPLKTLDQRGMSAIIITMVTMVVISLIVVGFATVSRREQRGSLDRLQSSQAFYAAESGIEDAKNAIRSWQNDPVTAATAIPAKDKCTQNNPAVSLYPTGNQMVVDDTYDVAYSCLTVNPAPGELQYDNVSANAVVVPISTDTSIGPITRLRITWQPTAPPAGTPAPTDCPTAPGAANRVFLPQSGSANNWSCGYGVLRTDVVPTNTGGALTSANINGQALTAFFAPTRTNGLPGTINYNTAGQTNVVAGDCDTVAYGKCQVTITNLNSGGVSTNTMTLRLSSIYQPSNITVEAFNGGTPLNIEGAQVEIDATGRATDVLRRIKVRIPVSQAGNGLLPSNALSSTGSICKRFSAATDYFNIPGDIQNPDDDPVTGNQMCHAQTDEVAVPPPPPPVCAVKNDIAFVLDISDSMNTQWGSNSRGEELQSVARRFINDTSIVPSANNAAIITFNDIAELWQPLTGNQTLLNQAIDDVYFDYYTYYSGGLDTGATELDNARAGVKKVMIFISDGAPTDINGNPASNALKNQIRNRATQIKNSGVAIYTVAIGDPGDPFNTLDKQLLTDMSGNGGSFADADSAAELQTIIDQLSNALDCN